MRGEDRALDALDQVIKKMEAREVLAENKQERLHCLVEERESYDSVAPYDVRLLKLHDRAKHALDTLQWRRELAKEAYDKVEECTVIAWDLRGRARRGRLNWFDFRKTRGA